MLKTGINFSKFGFDISDEDTFKLIKDVGFDTFFTGFSSEENTRRFKTLGEKVGLRYESIHAPFGGINHIWDEGEKGDEFVRQLFKVADTCAELEIEYFTLHCMNVPEFNVNVTSPIKCSALGIERFERVVAHAAEKGVRTCFENVEFPHFELRALLDTLRTKGYPSLGWTWDVGHEHCYPADGIDLIEEFGDLLVGTHIHDNRGQSVHDVITWNDDNHLFPFDGTIDFKRVGQKLKHRKYSGTITLEVNRKALLPEYQNMRIGDILQEAHKRAIRIAEYCE